jgi:hypothetical protein
MIDLIIEELESKKFLVKNEDTYESTELGLIAAFYDLKVKEVYSID